MKRIVSGAPPAAAVSSAACAAGIFAPADKFLFWTPRYAVHDAYVAAVRKALKP